MPDHLKVCNLDYLFELAKGDMEFVKEMLDVFLTDTPAELDNLSKCIAEENYPEIRQVAHKLRSTIPYVGLDELIGEEVQAIEEHAEKGSGIDDIKSGFLNVQKALQESFEELKLLKL
jgi:HPt (histidine-containing phosphotransfer) domain-containing protein